MIVLTAKYYCKPGKGEEVESYLKKMIPLVKENEIGCAVYFANRSKDNKDHFLLYEQYVDEAAFQAHSNTPYFKEIIEGKIIPILEKRERQLFTLVD